MSADWHQLPAIDLPSPVLALLAMSDALWAGGLGGLVRSPDGQTWSLAGAGLPLGSVTALAATEGLILAGGEGGLARSVDGGRTWLHVVLPDGTGMVSDFTLSPRFLEDGTALAATLDNGVLRSTDAGRSWQQASFGLGSSEVLALAWASEETVVAATSAGLYRSPNAGRAWRVIEATAGTTFVAVRPRENGQLLAAPAIGPPLLSSVGLTHWAPLDGPPADIQTSSMLAVDAETVLLGTAEGMLRSTADARWQLVSSEQVLTLAARNGRIYAGTDRGVMVSVDGGATWRNLPSPPLHDLQRLAIVQGMPLVSGRHSAPVLLDGDGAWKALQNAPFPQTGLFVLPGGALMAATVDGLFRSDDLGESWTSVGDTGAGITQMTFIDSQRGWAGGGNGAPLLRTGDGGRSWEVLDSPFGVLPLVALQALPAAPGRATISLIAATYDGRRHAVSVWRSDDGGERWVRGAESFTPWPVVASCGKPAAFSIGSTITVRQPDGSWQQAVVGNGGIRAIDGNGRHLLAFASEGLWRSDDAGTTWERSELDLPIEEVLDVALDGDELYVLLAGGRVLSRGLASGGQSSGPAGG